MKIDDITSYLYSSKTSDVIKQATEALSATDETKDLGVSFAEMLKAEVLKDSSSSSESDLSSMMELANLSKVMSGSVLGSITDPETLKTLSADLLSSGSGREIVAKLAEGHLNSIVMTDLSDLS